MSDKVNILELELGKPDDGIRKLKIVDAHIDTITFGDGHTGDKVFLKCTTEFGGKEVTISEAWSERKGIKEVQGLWVNFDQDGNLVANSTLGRLLKYLEASKLGDLIDMEVTGYPDPKNYLVLTTYDIENVEELIK